MKNNPQCILWLINVFLINAAIQLSINIKYIILWFKAFLGFDFFQKVYVSLIFLLHRYTSSEIRGKKLTVGDYILWINFKSKKNNKHFCTNDSLLNILHYWTVLSSLFIIITHKNIFITLIEKRSLQGLVRYMYFPRIVVLN